MRVLAKTMIVGDNRSGKSSLIYRFAQDSFDPNGCRGTDFIRTTRTYPHSMTKLFSTSPKLFRFPRKDGIVNSKHVPSAGDEATIIYELWDLITNERLFPEAVKIPFMVANCVIIIFDVTNQYSFDNLDLWIKQMYKHAKDLHSVIIVGSKVDLDDKRCISSQDAELFAKSYGFEYREFSSKTGQGVDGILDVLGQSLLLDDPIGGVVSKEAFNTHVDVDYEEKIEKEKLGSRCF